MAHHCGVRAWGRVNAVTGLSIALLTGCSGGADGSGSPVGTACRTEACRLAVGDAKDHEPASDALVHKYQIALDALGDNCNESEDELGDLAIAVQEELTSEGIEESLFNILSDVNSEMPGGYRWDDCSRPFAIYIFSRLGP